MRLPLLCAIALLPAALLAKDNGPDARFKKYHQKLLSNAPLKLDDGIYDHLTTTPRNFSSVVLLTALEAKFGCQLCRDFQPEWEVLARSWTRGDKPGDSRVLFGTLDFSDGKATFQKLMLQTAPVMLLFLPTTGPNAQPDGQPLRYDFTMGPQTAEQVHGWVSRHLPAGPKPPITRPINYIRLTVFATIALGGLSFFGVAWPYVMPIIQNRNLWAAISLIIVLLFTSGHMFNHIRKVPYVAGDGKGGISYFAGGFSNQFGMETQIIAAMYGVLSFAAIALSMKVPRISNPKTQQVAVIAWSGVMFFMYSFLLSVFKVKNGGYPFRLPPF